jgi:flagellar biosynthesis/type III secretory pathway chaperone
MKINSVLTLFVLAAVCLFSIGCNESMSSDQLRMAQLVGNENLQLKKDLATKDQQIADLKKQIEQAQQENDKIMEQHGNIYKKLMEIIQECQGKLEKYEQAGQTAPEPAKPDANQIENK